MRLVERCLKDFDSVIRARGDDVFRSQLVAVEEISSTAAEFQVRGSEPVRGRMDWSQADERGVLRADCSCRSFQKGEFCLHMWAAVLELDRRGRGTTIGGSGRIALKRLIPDERFSEPTLDLRDRSGATPPRESVELATSFRASTSSSTLTPALASSHLQTRAKRLPAKPDSSSGWKELLFKNRRSKSSSGGDLESQPKRRALFAVNLEQSRQSGRLAIELRYQDRLKSGEWGAVKSGEFDHLVIDEFEHDQDREILGMLLSPLNGTGKVLEIDPLLMNASLPQLIASERLFLVAESPKTLMEQKPLVLGENEWDFEIEVKDEKDGFHLEGFLLEGVLRRDREKVPLRGSKDIALLSAGYFVHAGSIERVAWGRNFALARHLALHSVFVPKADELDFVMSLAGDGDLPVVHLPPSLTWPLRQARPQAVARFFRAGDPQTNYVFAPIIVYDGLEIDARVPTKILMDPASRVRIKRDTKSEKVFLRFLKGPFALGKMRDGCEAGLALTGPVSDSLSLSEVASLIQGLQDNGWLIEVEKQRVLAFSGVEGTLRANGDGFDLQAAFDFSGEKLSFGAFFAACAKGERFARLSGGGVGFLSDEWVRKIDLLLRGASVERDGALRFKRVSLPLYRPLFEEMSGVLRDEEVEKVFAGLEKLANPEGVEKPRELKATLRHYQLEGLAWLESVAASGFGGILADDMGLGKTIQIISYLLRRATVPRTGPRPSLVVLPKSLVFNWLREVERFGPRLRVLDFAGASRGMLKAHEYDVVVTTYHVLKNEIDRFAKVEFDTVILDEAQTIKNPSSQVAQAVFLLRAAHRFALSGTPIENSLGDLFSLMRFTNPGLVPARLAASIGDVRGGNLSKEALERLSRALSPFMLRRTKKQVLSELPDKMEQALVCELESDQKKMYDRLRQQYRASLKQEIAVKGLGGAKMQVLEALLRMRQACCHPGLVDEKLVARSSAKFDMLLEHLEEIRASGNKVLVFSQFTSLLALLKPHLEREGIRYEYLDGQTRDRGSVVERFNSDPATTVFLISLKAGGTGLNLTSASYVFLLDPWWNPAIESQAIDRAYRMGQKQKVMAYRLIAEGTIEEKIMRLQAEKKSLAEAVVTEDPSFLRNLSVDDLVGLFE